MCCDPILYKIPPPEYGLNFSSLLLLTPGLSLLVRRIQVAHIFRKISQTKYGPEQLLISPDYLKLNRVYRYHSFGSLIQTVTLAMLSALNPLLLLPASFSFYELYSSTKAMFSEIIIIQNGAVIIRR